MVVGQVEGIVGQMGKEKKGGVNWSKRGRKWSKNGKRPAGSRTGWPNMEGEDVQELGIRKIWMVKSGKENNGKGKQSKF